MLLLLRNWFFSMTLLARFIFAVLLVLFPILTTQFYGLEDRDNTTNWGDFFIGFGFRTSIFLLALFILSFVSIFTDRLVQEN